MPAFRQTIGFSDGSYFSRHLEPDWEDGTWEREPKEGRWDDPFPNEAGNSQAFGMAESFAQSDLGAAMCYELGDPTWIEVTREEIR